MENGNCVQCGKPRARQTARQRLFFLCAECFHEQEYGRENPSPDDIRLACAIIQAGWSPLEERRAMGYFAPRPICYAPNRP